MRLKQLKIKTNPFGIKQKKKKHKHTTAQRVYLWEHNRNHKCNVCGKMIKFVSDMEIDHIRAYSKGGVKVDFAHRTCNRLKACKSIKQIKKELAIK